MPGPASEAKSNQSYDFASRITQAPTGPQQSHGLSTSQSFDQDYSSPPGPHFPVPQPYGQNPALPASPASPAHVRQPTEPNLTDFNKLLNDLKDDINSSMNPFQRNMARVLNVFGTLAAVGGAVAVGMLGMTALGSVATGVGLPVAAVAAISGVAVGLAGLVLTHLIGAGVRSMLRKNVRKDPKLAGRIVALQNIRDSLSIKSNLTKDEKCLLKNARLVLGKIDGFGANYKAQLKTSAKTLATIPAVALVLGVAFLSSSSSFFSSSCLDLGPFSSSSSYLHGRGRSAIGLEDSRKFLSELKR